MTAVTTVIQVIGLIGYIIILIFAAVSWQRWPELRGLLAFPALWALFGAVLYGFILTGNLSTVETLMWGAMHRLMAVMMILAGLVALWFIMTAQPSPPETDEHGSD